MDEEELPLADSALFKKATLLTAALLLSLQLYHVFSWPVWRDDTFFANVAKNLALGQGYEAVIFDKNYLFSYGITSGPLIILPTALMILLFGNVYWVPGVTAVIVIWSLLVAIYFAAGSFLGKERKWCFCVLFLWLILILSIGDSYNYGIETGDRFAIWCLLMGEIPAACCVIWSALLLFRPDLSRRRIFWGACILGVAVTTKSITAIAAAVITLAMAIRLIASRRYLMLAICFAGVALPTVTLEITKIVSMGWQSYEEMQADNVQFYHYHGVPNTLESNPAASLRNLIGNIFLFRTYFMGVPSIALFIAYLYIFKKIYDTAVNSGRGHIAKAGLILLMCFCAHALWWISLSGGYSRYLLTAFFYWAAGTAVLLSAANYQGTNLQLLVNYFMMAFALSHWSALHYLVVESLQTGNSHLVQQLSVVEKLNDLEKQKIPLYACGNNFELEYLMPGTNHFKPCSELVQGDQQAPRMLVNYFIKPNTILFAPVHSSYIAVATRVPPFALSLCNREYFSTEIASLLWCGKE